jgi:hypothetical protein
MPARDRYHDTVITALNGDGWTITHDPYSLPVGFKTLFVDLGSEKLIAAEREGRRIAVEIKGFPGPSEVRDLEEALGQYLLYAPFLHAREPERQLYLALPKDAYDSMFEAPIGQGLLKTYDLKLLVFDPVKEAIVLWLPPP